MATFQNGWCMRCKQGFEICIPPDAAHDYGPGPIKANPLHVVNCPRCGYENPFIPLGYSRSGGCGEGRVVAHKVGDQNQVLTFCRGSVETGTT